MGRQVPSCYGHFISAWVVRRSRGCHICIDPTGCQVKTDHNRNSNASPVTEGENPNGHTNVSPMGESPVKNDLAESEIVLGYCQGIKLSPVRESDPDNLKPSDPGAKMDAGKTQADLLEDFSLALTEVAKVGMFGMSKGYTRGSWQAVPNGIVRYGAALWRHLLARRHEDIDPQSGLIHDAAVAWNALARLELRLREMKGVK